MPFVDIQVIEGLCNHDEKREAVERVSEALLGVWGEAMRKPTHVAITGRPRAVSGPPAGERSAPRT